MTSRSGSSGSRTRDRCSATRAPGMRCGVTLALRGGRASDRSAHPVRRRAAAQQQSLRGSRYFQALFFMPFVIPFVAALFAWAGMLNPQTGWINGLAGIHRLEGRDWINDPDWIFPALVLIGIWGIGSAIIINLAGLQNVPTELYDAARVDGAGWWGQLRHVTLPLMSPVIFYSITLGTIGVLQYFLVPLVLNGGDGRPAGLDVLHERPHLQDVLHLPGHVGRRDAGLVPVPHHPRRSRSSCSGARATGSTTRGRRSRWPPTPSSLAAPPIQAIDRARRAPAGGPAWDPSLVRRHVLRGRGPRGLPVAAAPNDDDGAEDAGADRRHERSALASHAGDVRVRGRGARRLRRPDAGRHVARARPARARAAVERLRRSGRTRTPSRSPGRARGGRSSGHGSSTPHWENFGEAWTIIDFPLLHPQHRAAGPHRHAGDAALVCVGRVRLLALPIPRPQLPVPRPAVDDLPSGDRHPHSRRTRSSSSSAGWAPGSRSWCRRSSPTPTTSSCCASTS